MKKVWNGFLIAFSMFSSVPVPRADWDKDNMKYMMCFFPCVGVLIGALALGYGRLCTALNFGNLMRAAGLVCIPVLVTGGIHFDGFLDTQDALSSHQTRERKLEILKDPHTGAFAVIKGCVYFALSLGVWSEMPDRALPVIGVGFAVSRALSAYALCTFPCANRQGSLQMFADAAQKKAVKAVLVIWLLVCVLAAFSWDAKLAACLGAAAVAAYLYYHQMAVQEFGGTTGDIAGYFVQLCELLSAAAVMLGGKLL